MKPNGQAIALVVCVLVFCTFTCAEPQGDDSVNDKDIKVVSFKELNYPPLARSARIQGVVIVRVKLDGQGRVANAIGISGSDI